jgi:hypothetical protein
MMDDDRANMKARRIPRPSFDVAALAQDDGSWSAMSAPQAKLQDDSLVSEDFSV